MQTQALVKVQPTKAKQTQSALPPVTFHLKAPEAKEVLLAGDFTNWHLSARPLQRNGDGTWQTEIKLKPGRYQYKYIVDGQWLNDPGSSQFEPNSFGTVNNVREV